MGEKTREHINKDLSMLSMSKKKSDLQNVITKIKVKNFYRKHFYL